MFCYFVERCRWIDLEYLEENELDFPLAARLMTDFEWIEIEVGSTGSKEPIDLLLRRQYRITLLDGFDLQCTDEDCGKTKKKVDGLLLSRIVRMIHPLAWQ